MLTAKHTNHFCALNYYNYCKWNCTLCSTYLYSSIPQHFIVYRTLSHISIHRSIHLKWTEEEDVILKIMRRLENQQNCTYWAFLKLFFLYIYISPSKPQAENSLLLKHISESWGKKKKERERERKTCVTIWMPGTRSRNTFLYTVSPCSFSLCKGKREAVLRGFGIFYICTWIIWVFKETFQKNVRDIDIFLFIFSESFLRVWYLHPPRLLNIV